MTKSILAMKRLTMTSSAQEVACYVCGRGIDDGTAVTAKSLPNGIAMFCNSHYRMQ